MIRVVVADDQAAVRAGLVLILTAAEGIEVVGEAGDGEAAVSMARALRPDVVVMDVRMPVLDGIAATATVAAEGLGAVLVLTTFGIEEHVYGALRAGASGFLLKDTDAAGLVEAVRVVARGDAILSPGITRTLITTFASVAPPPKLDLDGLTPRERDVLAGIADGLSNAELADRLGMAESTVKTHVSRILAKLGLRSRVQAAVLVRELRA